MSRRTSATARDIRRNPPETCPLIIWANIISTDSDRLKYYAAKFAEMENRKIKPTPMMTTSDLLKEGFEKFFGIKVIAIKADGVKP